jgi:AcrR family transcriptional regulator
MIILVGIGPTPLRRCAHSLFRSWHLSSNSLYSLNSSNSLHLGFTVLAGRFFLFCVMSQSSTAAPPSRKRKRKDSREAILLAAEKIVARHGPASLTLESAAAEANVSKGGLFYHFRSKEVLLQEMIRRALRQLGEEREKVADSLSCERNAVMKAHIIGTLRHLEGQQPVLAAVIAAIANNPKLVDPMRESFKDDFQALCLNLSLSMEDTAILFLAAQGLLLLELLHLSFLTPSQIRKVTERMLQQVERLG